MDLSGKQLSVFLFFVMFVYSGFLKILNFNKKVDVLGEKTNLPKSINIMGMIGVIILEIVGSIIIVADKFYENLVPNLLTNLVYGLYFAFLVVVTLLYHPPSTHMVPFLSNVTTFGGLLYIFFDTLG